MYNVLTRYSFISYFQIKKFQYGFGLDVKDFR